MRLLLPALFLLTTTATAQNTAPAPPTPPNQFQTFPTPNPDDRAIAMLNLARMQAGACPVGFRAEQRGGGQSLWTIALEDQYTPDQNAPARPALRRPRPSDTGVHVNLNSLARSMRQVELSVSFLAPGGRVLPLSRQPSDRPPLRKTFTLSAADNSAPKLTGDLLIGATAGILRVHLLAIDFSDGTSWHPTAGHTCSVEPNRILLVDSR